LYKSNKNEIWLGVDKSYVIYLQLFSHHAEKSASNFPQFEPYTELSLVVRFKLQVHFAVFNSSSSASTKYSNGMEKLSIFLQEEGKKYAKVGAYVKTIKHLITSFK